MAFQDFDQISERRRLERQIKYRKRIIISVISSVLFVGLVAGGTFAVITSHNNKNNDTSHNNKNIDQLDHKHTPPPSSQSSKQNPLSDVSRTISSFCNATNYKVTCQNTFKKALQNNATTQPKDFVRIAIQAADDQIDKVFNKISTFEFNSPKEKAAFENCRQLVEDAKKELKSSITSATDDIENLSKNAPELNNWLSAVMSYQETCIDGFPEGKLKSNVNQTFKIAKEHTSNSLASVALSTKFLSSFHLSVGSRRLMEEATNTDSVGQDGVPNWLNRQEHRMLKSATDGMPAPNVVVAKDGSGDFTTVSAALAAMPATYNGRYVIYVKTGVYEETVSVRKPNVTMYGDGSQKSIVTGSKNYVDGVQRIDTATFAVIGDGFFAKALGFRNIAGPEKHQAVALRVQGDRAIFLNCRFEGYQDTLLAQAHRQFYRSCVISGTVDFIFGDAAAIFQNCLIIVRKPLDGQQNTVTAQGRTDSFETTGFVLQNCRFEADKDLVPTKSTVKSYLGRPWKDYSRTIVMESKIGDLIDREGWLPWAGSKGLDTLYYAEFDNTGPGASTAARVKWPGYHVIDRAVAMNFTVGTFLQGADWITATGSPVRVGLSN